MFLVIILLAVAALVIGTFWWLDEIISALDDFDV